jgi:hypothetical protein
VSGDDRISFELRETVGTVIVGPLGSHDISIEIMYLRIQRFTLNPKKPLAQLLWVLLILSGFKKFQILISLFFHKKKALDMIFHRRNQSIHHPVLLTHSEP